MQNYKGDRAIEDESEDQINKTRGAFYKYFNRFHINISNFTMQTACFVVLFNKLEFSVQIFLHTLNRGTYVAKKGLCIFYNYYFMLVRK